MSRSTRVPIKLADSRCLSTARASKVADESVDLVLTSPPYADLKDYGSASQIGYGQTYDNYLRDMRHIFSGCFRVAKPSASMWIVVDTLRKNGSLKLLPFELAREAATAGWQPQEVVIWDKHRTLPWSHHGHMRNVFEYIVSFSKTQDFKYYLDRIRESDDLREWWVNYPERYHPAGKAPSNVWSIDIPVQGSWGNGSVRHANPLPLELIERIVSLTTDEGDVVLDPFAGVGSVIAQATVMGRSAKGFDLNPQYVSQYPTLLEIATKRWAKRQTAEGKLELIPRLRMLKYAKQIYKRATTGETDFGSVLALIVNQAILPTTYLPPNIHWGMDLTIVTQEPAAPTEALAASLRDLGSRPPFSKYGLSVNVNVASTSDLNASECYWAYETGRFRKPGPKLSLADAIGRNGRTSQSPVFLTTFEIVV